MAPTIDLKASKYMSLPRTPGGKLRGLGVFGLPSLLLKQWTAGTAAALLTPA
jgi:hypothetical protein